MRACERSRRQEEHKAHWWTDDKDGKECFCNGIRPAWRKGRK